MILFAQICRVCTGSDTGAWRHESFVRGQPHDLEVMTHDRINSMVSSGRYSSAFRKKFLNAFHEINCKNTTKEEEGDPIATWADCYSSFPSFPSPKTDDAANNGTKWTGKEYNTPRVIYITEADDDSLSVLTGDGDIPSVSSCGSETDEECFGRFLDRWFEYLPPKNENDVVLAAQQK